MVTKPTVLVVGAGGSMPYGFPSGTDLVTKIVDKISIGYRGSAPIGLNDETKLLLTAGYDPEQLKQFAQALDQSHATSPDAFLEQRPMFVDIGKAAIAAILMPYETRSLTSLGNCQTDHWYKYLLNQLYLNVANKANKPLTVLTYNYDRSLEHYLYSSFEAYFGADEHRMKSLFSTLTIIHLHGSLGLLPWQSNSLGSSVRAYGSSGSVTELKDSVRNITIIHETKDDSESYKEAQKQFAAADRACFLGFGYHPTNVRRILAGNWIGRRHKNQILGSAYNLTDAEKLQRTTPFRGSINLGQSGWKCEEYLKQVVWMIS